jgi:uncharacterized OsmC-like protein
MATLPGTIALGKFRIIFEEEGQRSSTDTDRYLLQQRAIIRLNEDLVRLADQEDYTVYCKDDEFMKQVGKRPSALQYFIASIGFCMFSQLKRLAAEARVLLDDLEMDLSMTYDLKGSFSVDSPAQAARGISYTFKIKTESPLETMIKVMQAADKGCHTVNSMRKRMAIAGKFVLDGREYQIGD